MGCRRIRVAGRGSVRRCSRLSRAESVWPCTKTVAEELEENCSKKAESRRIVASELWCWRRLLRVPWKARRSNQSILKEITLNTLWKDWCWSWSSNTLATWWNSWLTGKDPDAGKDWRQKEKSVTEDEMVGWHHWFNGHKLGQTRGDGEGQRSLACCSPWRCEEVAKVAKIYNLVTEQQQQKLIWDVFSGGASRLLMM